MKNCDSVNYPMARFHPAMGDLCTMCRRCDSARARRAGEKRAARASRRATRAILKEIARTIG